MGEERKQEIKHRGTVKAPYIIRYMDGTLESAGTDLDEAKRRAKEKAHKHGGVELII